MSTDPARLTDDEREDLWRAYESWTEGDFSEHMGRAVEGMIGKRLAAVRALAGGPTSNGHRPYAVELDDGVHLAVLLDDLRDALEGR